MVFLGYVLALFFVFGDFEPYGCLSEKQLPKGFPQDLSICWINPWNHTHDPATLKKLPDLLKQTRNPKLFARYGNAINGIRLDPSAEKEGLLLHAGNLYILINPLRPANEVSKAIIANLEVAILIWNDKADFIQWTVRKNGWWQAKRSSAGSYFFEPLVIARPRQEAGSPNPSNQNPKEFSIDKVKLQEGLDSNEPLKLVENKELIDLIAQYEPRIKIGVGRGGGRGIALEGADPEVLPEEAKTAFYELVIRFSEEAYRELAESALASPPGGELLYCYSLESGEYHLSLSPVACLPGTLSEASVAPDGTSAASVPFRTSEK